MRLLRDPGQNGDYRRLWNCLTADVHSDINWQPHASCYTLLPGPTWHFPYLVAFTYYNSTCEYPHPVSCINLWGLSSGVEDMHFVLQLLTPYFICTTLLTAQVEWPASFAGLPCSLLTNFQSWGLAIALHVMVTCMLRAEAHLHTDSGWAQGFVNSTARVSGYLALAFLVLGPDNWYFRYTGVLHSSVTKLRTRAKQKMRERQNKEGFSQQCLLPCSWEILEEKRLHTHNWSNGTVFPIPLGMVYLSQSSNSCLVHSVVS